VTAHADYTAFDDAWDSVRDDVLVSSPTAYSAIEDSASTVEGLWSDGTPSDSAATVAAVKTHRDLVALTHPSPHTGGTDGTHRFEASETDCRRSAFEAPCWPALA